MKQKHQRSFDLLSRYDYYYPGIGGVFALLALLLAGACVGNLVILVLTKYLGTEIASTYGMLISYPLQFLPAMIYAAAKSNPFDGGQECVRVDDGRFAPIGGAWLSVMAITVTWASAVMCEPSGLLLPEMPELLKNALKSMTEGPLWVSILTTAVFAPFFEEWLCRGMVLRGLLQKMHPAWAIMISAIFFALIHMNPWQAVPAFILGCLFGYVYYKTGSLKLTMLMHCTNNAFSVLLTRIPGMEDCDYLYQAIDNWTAYGIIYGVCAGVAIWIITKLKETNFTYDEE